MQHPAPGQTSGNGLLELHLAVLLFGFASLFGKFLTLPPITLVCGRASIAAVALLLWLAASGRRRLSRAPDADIAPHSGWYTGPRGSQFVWLVASGALLAVHWAAFFQSVQTSSVALALVAFASFPLFTTLLEPWLERRAPRGLDLATALVVAVGLCAIAPSYDLNSPIVAGLCWGLLSGLTFALLAVFNRRLVVELGAVRLAAWQNLAAALCLTPFVPWITLSLTARDWLLLCVLGVACTAVAHGLFIHALRRATAQLAGIITALEAVYGAALAWLFLGEAPTTRTLCGGSIVLVAVMLGSWFREIEPITTPMSKEQIA